MAEEEIARVSIGDDVSAALVQMADNVHSFADTVAESLDGAAAASDGFYAALGRSLAPFSSIIGLTGEARDALQALVESFLEGRVSIQEMRDAGYSEADMLAELTRLTMGATISLEDLGAAGVKLGSIEAVLANLTDHMTILQAATKAAADGFTAFNQAGSASMDALTIAELRTVDATLSVDEAAMIAVENIQIIGAASVKGAEAQTQLAIAVLQAVDTLRQEAVAAGASAQVLADLATIEREVGIQAQTLAASVKVAGEESATASSSSGGFGLSQYMLMMLAFQALGAVRSMIQLGNQIQDTSLVIQGMTGASDQQMQQWATDVENVANQYGMLVTDVLPELETITRAQFQGADATLLLSDATELARTTASSMSDATDTLTLSLRAYGLGAESSHYFAGLLFDSFSHGTLTMQQFHQILSASIQDAKDLGISFPDLTNAIAQFSLTAPDGTIAMREFQSILGGVTTFSNLTTVQLNKLAGGIDMAKFSAMDFSGKLGDLANAAQGNTAEFTTLLGGLSNAQQVMDSLNISTRQLQINADNLGLSFDPVKYNALDAAGKLLYLEQSADFVRTKFDALVGGTKNANQALSDLGPTLDAAGQKLADLGTGFDHAKFMGDSLAQKLHDIADFLGGTGTSAFATYVGGIRNVGPAIALMNTVADSNLTPMAQHVDHVRDRLLALNDTTDHMSTIPHTVPKSYSDMDSSAAKLAQDNKAAIDKMHNDWANFAIWFATDIEPLLTGAALQYAQGDKVQNFKPPARDPWQGFKDWFSSLLEGINLMIAMQVGQWGQDFNNFATTVSTNISIWATVTLPNYFKGMGSSVSTTISDMVQGWLLIFEKWIQDTIYKFTGLRVNLIGGSIIPDMLDAISLAFSNATGIWSSIMQGGINSIEGIWNNAIGIAYNAGRSIVFSLGNGLSSLWGWLQQQASNLMGAIFSVLPRSPAKFGPLMDIDKSMPAMIDLLAHGIDSNLYKLRSASINMAATIAAPIQSVSTATSATRTATSDSSGMTAVVNVLIQIYQVLKSQQTTGQQGSWPAQQGYRSGSSGPLSPQQLNALYQVFNSYSGLAYEAGGRGAFAGFGV